MAGKKYTENLDTDFSQKVPLKYISVTVPPAFAKLLNELRQS